MSYRVFARKYRPQRFDEVVGQEPVTRTLQNAIAQKRLAQAYLFVGPRGIGKTSTARILAKALNCANGPTAEPCGECDACKEITEGNSLDVLEIDGASNNSVEHVRELRENVAYAPARGPFKIYMIDEVHMLSTSAFNALLKTLEEPPEHVKFIFATTEAQKLPATITSRCQRFDLRRISTEAIAKHLLKIAEAEKIQLDPAAAESIARGADGGLRDAESMLDQVVAFCGDKVDFNDVLNVFGFTAPETIAKLCEALFTGDTGTALALVHEQNEAGKDLLRLVVELISSLRDMLVASVGRESRVPPSRLLELIEHFSAVETRLRWAPDKKLHVEVAIIKAIHLLNQATLDDVLETLGAIQSGETPPVSQRPTLKIERKVETTVRVETPISKAQIPAPESPRTPNFPAPGAAPLAGPSDGLDIWEKVITRLAHDSPMKFQWLTSARFGTKEGVEFRIQIPASYRHHMDGFIWQEVRKLLEAELGKEIGGRAKVTAEVGDFHPEMESTEEAPASAPAGKPAAATVAATAAPREEKPPEDPDAEFRNDPLIKKALEIFGREIQTSS